MPLFAKHLGSLTVIYTVTEATWEVVPATLFFYGFYLDTGAGQSGDIAPATHRGIVVESAGYYSTGSLEFGLAGDLSSDPKDAYFYSIVPEGDGTFLATDATVTYNSGRDVTEWAWSTAAVWDGTGTSDLIVY